MGLFGKMKAGLKSVANKVTGGYGEVSITFDKEAYQPGDTVVATILVNATEELKVTNIMARAEGYETSNYKDEDYLDNAQASSSHSDYTLKEESEVCKEMVMPAGDSKSFEYKLTLPAETPPTYLGEHIKNSYHLKVQVDIPWGVDLRKTEQFTVVKHPSPNRFDEIRVQQQNRLCKVELVLPRATVKPGQNLEYSLTLTPSEPLDLESVTIGLRSIESMAGRVGYRERDYDGSRGHGRGRRRYSEEDDGEWDEERESYRPSHDVDSSHNDDEETLYWENEQLEVRVDEVEETPLRDSHLATAQEVKGHIEVPQGFGASYRRGDLEHRLVFVASIDTGNRSTLEFEQEILVCGGDWEAVEAVASVAANPEFISRWESLAAQYGQQIQVSASQQGLVVSDGVIDGVFHAGQHGLSPENAPSLGTASVCDLYHISVAPWNIRWGMSSPGIWHCQKAKNLEIRAHGTASLEVQDPSLFLNLIQKTPLYLTKDLQAHLVNDFVSAFMDAAGQKSYETFAELNADHRGLGDLMLEALAQKFAKQGMRLTELDLHAVSLSERSRERYSKMVGEEV